ncbi:MAG: hypothetical protein ALAOOOJD_02464 [bacterium]|nr:hypothetical protein [bacterium]
MHFGDIADRTIFDPFHHQTIAFTGAALVAHLRHDFVLARGQSQLARFPNIVCQRLLAIHVFLFAHRRHRGKRMQIVRSRDTNGVDTGFFFEHVVKIDVGIAAFVAAVAGLFGIGVIHQLFRRLAALDTAKINFAVIHFLNGIGDRDHLHFRQLHELCHVICTLPADADDRKIDLVTRRDVTRAAKNATRHNRKRRGGAGGAQKLPAGHAWFFVVWLVFHLASFAVWR